MTFAGMLTELLFQLCILTTGLGNREGERAGRERGRQRVREKERER